MFLTYIKLVRGLQLKVVVHAVQSVHFQQLLSRLLFGHSGIEMGVSMYRVQVTKEKIISC